MLRLSVLCLTYLLGISLSSMSQCAAACLGKLEESKDLGSSVSKSRATDEGSYTPAHLGRFDPYKDPLLEDVFAALRKDNLVEPSIRSKKDRKEEISKLQKSYYPSGIVRMCTTLSPMSTIKKCLGIPTITEIEKACEINPRCTFESDSIIQRRIELYLAFLSGRRFQKGSKFTKLDALSVIGLLRLGARNRLAREQVCRGLKQFSTKNKKKQKFIEMSLDVIKKKWEGSFRRIETEDLIKAEQEEMEDSHHGAQEEWSFQATDLVHDAELKT